MLDAAPPISYEVRPAQEQNEEEFEPFTATINISVCIVNSSRQIDYTCQGDAPTDFIVNAQVYSEDSLVQQSTLIGQSEEVKTIQVLVENTSTHLEITVQSTTFEDAEYKTFYLYLPPGITEYNLAFELVKSGDTIFLAIVKGALSTTNREIVFPDPTTGIQVFIPLVAN